MPIERELFGVIFPLRRNNFELLKIRKNPIYIKYITHSKSKYPTKLHSGHYLFFYISREKKSLIGYSKIKGVKFDLPSNLVEISENNIQMNMDEFKNYTNDRNFKLMLVIELEKIIEFEKPNKIAYPITMAGRYVYSDENNIIENIKS
jgi:hypothetical protein